MAPAAETGAEIEDGVRSGALGARVLADALEAVDQCPELQDALLEARAALGQKRAA